MEDLISYTINFVMCAATHVFAQIFCMDQSDQVHFTAINFLFEQCYSEVLPHAVTSNDMFSSGCVCDEVLVPIFGNVAVTISLKRTAPPELEMSEEEIFFF
jgi:hypothetical protein